MAVRCMWILQNFILRIKSTPKENEKKNDLYGEWMDSELPEL